MLGPKALSPEEAATGCPPGKGEFHGSDFYCKLCVHVRIPGVCSSFLQVTQNYRHGQGDPGNFFPVVASFWLFCESVSSGLSLQVAEDQLGSCDIGYRAAAFDGTGLLWFVYLELWGSSFGRLGPHVLVTRAWTLTLCGLEA